MGFASGLGQANWSVGRSHLPCEPGDRVDNSGNNQGYQLTNHEAVPIWGVGLAAHVSSMHCIFSFFSFSLAAAEQELLFAAVRSIGFGGGSTFVFTRNSVRLPRWPAKSDQKRPKNDLKRAKYTPLVPLELLWTIKQWPRFGKTHYYNEREAHEKHKWKKQRTKK